MTDIQMPPAGQISDVLRKVSRDIEEGRPIRDVAATEVALPDPSPSPMDLHREKLSAIVDTACAVALDNGRLLVERQHALMRAVQAKRDHVHEVIADYLQLVDSTTRHGVVIHDSLVELERQFGSAVVIDPPPSKPAAKGNGKRA